MMFSEGFLLTQDRTNAKNLILKPILSYLGFHNEIAFQRHICQK